eukprot:CAMPEP_0202924100 /NCGR_PEP_ID=MMETSP1392-20130828/78793_1 /ASSEMBLY_ACC=CAM_ASM_000868 /TAXON_ID=225041 /ORGANISM="Chlamydomonas chlamydogama, Strain SAG 11-48b" /LENGTH=811 /DNA_ID=CAMNT_0049617813 /DNA_START=34 /DNA_END=2469 /DNA_ORIENTATION=-
MSPGTSPIRVSGSMPAMRFSAQQVEQYGHQQTTVQHARSMPACAGSLDYGSHDAADLHAAGDALAAGPSMSRTFSTGNCAAAPAPPPPPLPGRRLLQAARLSTSTAVEPTASVCSHAGSVTSHGRSTDDAPSHTASREKRHEHHMPPAHAANNNAAIHLEYAQPGAAVTGLPQTCSTQRTSASHTGHLAQHHQQSEPEDMLDPADYSWSVYGSHDATQAQHPGYHGAAQHSTGMPYPGVAQTPAHAIRSAPLCQPVSGHADDYSRVGESHTPPQTELSLAPQGQDEESLSPAGSENLHVTSAMLEAIRNTSCMNTSVLSWDGRSTAASINHSLPARNMVGLSHVSEAMLSTGATPVRPDSLRAAIEAAAAETPPPRPAPAVDEAPNSALASHPLNFSDEDAESDQACSPEADAEVSAHMPMAGAAHHAGRHAPPVLTPITEEIAPEVAANVDAGDVVLADPEQGQVTMLQSVPLVTPLREINKVRGAKYVGPLQRGVILRNDNLRASAGLPPHNPGEYVGPLRHGLQQQKSGVRARASSWGETPELRTAVQQQAAAPAVEQQPANLVLRAASLPARVMQPGSKAHVPETLVRSNSAQDAAGGSAVLLHESGLMLRQHMVNPAPRRRTTGDTEEATRVLDQRLFSPMRQAKPVAPHPDGLPTADTDRRHTADDVHQAVKVLEQNLFSPLKQARNVPQAGGRILPPSKPTAATTQGLRAEAGHTGGAGRVAPAAGRPSARQQQLDFASLNQDECAGTVTPLAAAKHGKASVADQHGRHAEPQLLEDRYARMSNSVSSTATTMCGRGSGAKVVR